MKEVVKLADRAGDIALAHVHPDHRFHGVAVIGIDRYHVHRAGKRLGQLRDTEVQLHETAQAVDLGEIMLLPVGSECVLVDVLGQEG